MAQNSSVFGGLGRLVADALSFINDLLIPLLIAFALVYFFWGLLKYIGGGKEEADKTASKHIITRGIVGLVIMVSVWGIVYLVKESLGIGGNVRISTPKVI